MRFKTRMENELNNFNITSLSILFVLATSMRKSEAKTCYSCSGVCHNSGSCNCQMGSCESNYCFIEKKPTDAGMFRLTKGCVKRPSRTRPGCDFDHFPDHIRCVCQGDFCNDVVLLKYQQRRNVTCRSCPEARPDCSDTCQGQWCHEMVNTGATGCGYGPPSLPYFYETPELLFRVPKVCITMSRGSGSQHKYCICSSSSNLCNDYNAINSEQGKFSSYISTLLGPNRQPGEVSEASLSVAQQMKSRSLNAYYTVGNIMAADEFYECVNCDLTTEQNSLTSACKQNRCFGQFCTYVMQRTIGSTYGSNGAIPRLKANQPHLIIHERQGCINVTDKTYIQLGCSHKWMNNEEEELYCACKGNLCNHDITTVSASGCANQLEFKILLLIMATIMLTSHLCVHFS